MMASNNRTSADDATVTDPEETVSAEERRAQLWESWDAEVDREEGPFDISEVDLDADDVQRIDFGSLVVTPFKDMQLQLQVDKKKDRVQALLVTDGQSAIEVALFAGPARTSMIPEIRNDIIAAAERAGGRVKVVRGPFGAELHRHVPVTDPKGNPAMHVSRTWLVDGPGWVLRGVVMGKAALDYKNEEVQQTLFEFFSDLVVRRGTQPAVPGSVIGMTIPTKEEPGEAGMTAQEKN